MKTSLISIMPITLQIQKPTVHPAQFTLPACDRGDIKILHLIDAACWIYMDGDRGHFKQLIPSDVLAESIVMDYREASLGTTDNSYPGMFHVEGWLGHNDPQSSCEDEGCKDEIRKKFKDRLAEISQAQDNWLNKLVMSADDEWNKYHQHRAITGLARTAARYLGLERAWKVDNVSPMIPCPACSNAVFESAVICPSCNLVLDEKRYKSMKFAGAESHENKQLAKA